MQHPIVGPASSARSLTSHLGSALLSTVSGARATCSARAQARVTLGSTCPFRRDEARELRHIALSLRETVCEFTADYSASLRHALDPPPPVPSGRFAHTGDASGAAAIWGFSAGIEGARADASVVVADRIVSGIMMCPHRSWNWHVNNG